MVLIKAKEPYPLCCLDEIEEFLKTNTRAKIKLDFCKIKITTDEINELANALLIGKPDFDKKKPLKLAVIKLYDIEDAYKNAREMALTLLDKDVSNVICDYSKLSDAAPLYQVYHK